MKQTQTVDIILRSVFDQCFQCLCRTFRVISKCHLIRTEINVCFCQCLMAFLDHEIHMTVLRLGSLNLRLLDADFHADILQGIIKMDITCRYSFRDLRRIDQEVQFIIISGEILTCDPGCFRDQEIAV